MKYNKTFFIADTHFGDENVINYENRPFKNISEMDNAIIKNWNSVVSNEDRIFVLGDFSFYDINKTKEIGKALNGIKILVLGNHDTYSIDDYIECSFEEVIQYPIILDEFWMLSHEPLYINKNMPYANIYGHVHGNIIYRDYSSQSFCASIERIEYTPIEFEKIKTLIQKDYTK